MESFFKFVPIPIVIISIRLNFQGNILFLTSHFHLQLPIVVLNRFVKNVPFLKISKMFVVRVTKLRRKDRIRQLRVRYRVKIVFQIVTPFTKIFISDIKT